MPTCLLAPVSHCVPVSWNSIVQVGFAMLATGFHAARSPPAVPQVVPAGTIVTLETPLIVMLVQSRGSIEPLVIVTVLVGCGFAFDATRIAAWPWSVPTRTDL